MANGAETIKQSRNDRLEKSMPVALAYLRELGSMAILAGVLYGAYDVVKTEGQDFNQVQQRLIDALDKQTETQKAILDYLKAQENRRVPINPYGPPSPYSSVQPPTRRRTN
jgi:hypothetical protein